MGYYPIEDLLPKAGNSIYKLVRLASCRAIELADGNPKLLKEVVSDKSTTTALEEISQGKVVLGAAATAGAGKGKKGASSEEKE